VLPIPVNVRRQITRIDASVQQYRVTLPQRLFDHNGVSRLDIVRHTHQVWPLIRPYRPIARRADVIGALTDSATFVTCYPEDLIGDFVARFDGDRHTKLRVGIASALGDLQAAEDLASRTARERVACRVAAGSLDVGTDLVYPVMIRMVEEYVGLSGQRSDVLLAWGRDLFQGIFLNAYGMPFVHEAARIAKDQMSAHVDELIEEVNPASATVLAKLAYGKEKFAMTEVRDNIIGLAIGWLWHGARAAIIAVDELLKRPTEMAVARRAAQQGDSDTLQRVLWEILRFRPVQVGLVRECARDTDLSDGTRVRRHAKVLLGTHSAMWDEEVIPDPSSFDCSRAPGQYLIFGRGPHECPGASMMRRQLPAMLAPLLRQHWLRRAGGRDGRLRWVGPSPDGFRVLLPAVSGGG
jgi:cytochrome P450